MTRPLTRLAIVTVIACALPLLLGAADGARPTLESLQTLVDQGNYEKALAQADVYLEVHPGNRNARFLRAVALAGLGRNDAAIKAFTALAKAWPNQPEPANNLAALYARRGQYKKARKWLQQALATQKVYAIAHRNLGDVYTALATMAYSQILDGGDGKARDKGLQLALVDHMYHPEGTGLLLPPQTPARTQRLAANTGGATQAGTPASAGDAGTTTEQTQATVVQPPPPEPEPAYPPTDTPEPQEPAPVESAGQESAAQERTVQEQAGEEQAGQRSTSEERAQQPASEERTSQGPTSPEPREPESREPAPSEPAPSADTRIAQAVYGWAKAWSRQDYDAYIGYYTRDFPNDGRTSRSQWLANRKQRVTQKAAIEVRVIAPDVTRIDANSARVSFIQTYESPSYSDTVHKRLVMRRTDAGWRIERETSTLIREGISLVLARAADGQPESKPAEGTDEPAADADTQPDPGADKRIAQTVYDWAEAWSNQDYDAYIGYYTRDFPNDGDTSRSQWLANRKRRVTQKATIEVQVISLEVTRIDADSARASFIQTYESATYSDKVRKWLLMRRTDAGWRIAHEVSTLLSRG